MKTDKRIKRMWWTNVDDSVRKVTAFECQQTASTVWFCPKLGYSLWVGKHLFTTEKEAKENLISNLTKELETITKKIEWLRKN